MKSSCKNQWQFIHIPKCGALSGEEFLDSGGLPAHKFDTDVKTLSVIRHPLDRLVSIYYSGIIGKPKRSFQPIAAFQKWVQTDNWKDIPVLPSPINPVPISSPQVDWIRDDTFLIRLDDFQNGLDKWADFAGFPRRKMARYLKTSARPNHWRSCFTEKQIAKLSLYYAADLAMWRENGGVDAF